MAIEGKASKHYFCEIFKLFNKEIRPEKMKKNKFMIEFYMVSKIRVIIIIHHKVFVGFENT